MNNIETNSFQEYFESNRIESKYSLNYYYRSGSNNLGDNKTFVIVIDKYTGIKGFFELPKKTIIFTSNESSDYILDNNEFVKIIYIPLLNNKSKTCNDVNVYDRKYLYSFIGAKTHKIRFEMVERMQNWACLVSFDKVGVNTFNSIIANSVFTLCPRGVNVSSYRICEALRYGSIPVYISDKFILPENFEDYGIAIHSDNLSELPDLLKSIPKEEINRLIENGKIYYEKLFTYEGLTNWIYDKLKTLTENGNLSSTSIENF